jgi:anti-sigma factor RsiW
MDFIDDELSEKVRSDFLAHSVSCPACRKELKELQYVKKALAALPPVTVSSEFDFRLKASLRMEGTRLRSPMYRLKLFLKDNLVPAVGAPVAATLLVGGVLLYNGPFSGARPEIQAVQQKPAAVPERVQASAVIGPQAEDVHYVLDSVELSAVGTSKKPNGKTMTDLSTENSINLIRY